jgi:gliding motility-associated-like protein
VKHIFFFLFIFTVLALPPRVVAQIGFPYCESFQTASTQATTIFGGKAWLPPGEGVLRLTSDSTNWRGYVYLDIPFPSSYGLKAEFEYFSYGGKGPGSDSPGDGFSVFLFDAETPSNEFNAGGFGGSLGYGPRNSEKGLSKAYLGIGFDEFGGFGTTAGGLNGSFPNQPPTQLAPNSIVVRGPGNLYSGYSFVMGKRTMQDGPNGLIDDDQFPISSGGVGTSRVSDREKPGYRKVFLELQPNPTGAGFFLTLKMEVTTEPNQPRPVTIFDRQPYFFSAPNNLKIGFAASTGGSTNFHEIRNLIVEVAANDALQNPDGVDIADRTSCAGQKNQFKIEDADVRLPNGNSTIRCLQFYKSLGDIEAENSDICLQARCLEENRIKIFPEGIFEATDQAGGFTFLPNAEFIDQEVTVFYTITDNYGKTSSGNKITLLIKESPDPITLRAEGQVGTPQELAICEGDAIVLSGSGNEVYTRFEWKKNGELIGGATQAELLVDDIGDYEIIGYNLKNCPAISNTLKVKWVEYPELRLTEPVVGCLPGESLDLSDFIVGFDLQVFDYRLVGAGLDLENEALKEISTSGQFELQVKPKGFACYSDAFEVEVFIQEEALEVKFDFGVAETGIKDDAGGGVFPDDLIKFTNLSEDRLVTWEWSFGDSTSSSEKEPSHTFGKKGEFEVLLVGTDRYGCQNTFTQKVSITNSYRLMVPNAFKPNAPEIENKTFFPKYKSIAQLELSIFNQWGELIYRSSDLSNVGWDGKVNGVLQETGFYFYGLVGVATDGTKVASNGKFRLIR